jgi:hypothetical protein
MTKLCVEVLVQPRMLNFFARLFFLLHEVSSSSFARLEGTLPEP